jgi:hypothetical protein
LIELQLPAAIRPLPVRKASFDFLVVKRFDTGKPLLAGAAFLPPIS